MLGGAIRVCVGGGTEAIAVAAATGSISASVMARPGLAKSALGLLECNGEALGGESGILAWEASTAALFPNGLADKGLAWGSLKGFSVGAELAAPGRSQALLGRSGRSRSLDGVGGATASRLLPPLLLLLVVVLSKAGSNWVRGLSSRRGAVDGLRSLCIVGTGCTASLGIGAGAAWT
jgi:hypothetical protein